MNSQRKLDDKLVEWLLFLEDPENKNMEVLQMKNPQIKKAMSVLEFISSDREARKLYEAREKDLRDRLGQIAYAREEGEYKKALETSKRMIRDGMPLDVISKYTELTIEELEKLKKEVVEDNKQ
jgi:predicted transposase/invertase (TIGR01784 family)